MKEYTSTHRRLLLFFAMIVLGVSFTTAQETHTLKFQLENGSRYSVVTKMKSTLVQNVLGQDMNIDMDYDVHMTYDVADEGDHKTVHMVYDQLKMNMNAVGKKITMNSEDPDTANTVSKGFRALKGQKLSATLDANGKVIKVEGFKEILNKMSDDAIWKETLEGLLSEDAIKDLLAQTFSFYPGKPVKTGDSWTSSYALRSPYSIKTNNTYTLDKVEGKKALINTTSKLVTDSSSKMTYSGMEMALDLTGDISGRMEVDMDSGMPLSSKARKNVKGNVKVQGQTIPMAMSSDIEMIATKNYRSYLKKERNKKQTN